MMTSVKVLQDDGTKLFITQLVSPFFDSVSVAHGSGMDVCDARSYSISSLILTTATASLTTAELYINSITGLIHAWSSNNLVVGTHDVTVTAKLTKYSAIPSISATF